MRILNLLKMHSEEIWKPVPGYEGLYEISNLGRMKSLSKNYSVQIRSNCKIDVVRKEKILKLFPSKKGYFYCRLIKNSKYKSYQVHILVFNTFSNVFYDNKLLVINHKDGNGLNNNINNLEIVTLAENQLHRYKGLNYIYQNKDVFRKKSFYYQFTFNKKRIKSKYFSTYKECKINLLLKLKELNYWPKYLNI